jgi:hypothetical protein
MSSMNYYFYGSTSLCWASAAFSVSWFYTQSVGLLESGISPSQGRYLHTGQHKHRIKTHNTDIHDLNGIRTHDPSVRASEDSSCEATVIGSWMKYGYLILKFKAFRSDVCEINFTSPGIIRVRKTLMLFYVNCRWLLPLFVLRKLK